MKENWILFSEEKPRINKDYLCFWNQIKIPNHLGFMVFYWSGDRWSTPNSLHGHEGKYHVTHWQELEAPSEPEI